MRSARRRRPAANLFHPRHDRMRIACFALGRLGRSRREEVVHAARSRQQTAARADLRSVAVLLIDYSIGAFCSERLGAINSWWETRIARSCIGIAERGSRRPPRSALDHYTDAVADAAAAAAAPPADAATCATALSHIQPCAATVRAPPLPRALRLPAYQPAVVQVPAGLEWLGELVEPERLECRTRGNACTCATSAQHTQ